jgi:hypothetical protein
MDRIIIWEFEILHLLMPSSPQDNLLNIFNNKNRIPPTKKSTQLKAIRLFYFRSDKLIDI